MYTRALYQENREIKHFPITFVFSLLTDPFLFTHLQHPSTSDLVEFSIYSRSTNMT